MPAKVMELALDPNRSPACTAATRIKVVIQCAKAPSALHDTHRHHNHHHRLPDTQREKTYRSGVEREENKETDHWRESRAGVTEMCAVMIMERRVGKILLVQSTRRWRYLVVPEDPTMASRTVRVCSR